jgi:phenylalanyl-tRNA synthetase alpha subunit
MSNVVEIVLISDDEIAQVRKKNESGLAFNGIGADLVVTLDNGLKYLGCMVTIKCLKHYFNRTKCKTENAQKFYWCEHLIVVKDLEMDTIKSVLNEMLHQCTFSKAFKKII